jgi:hypothetical protein
MDDSIPTWTQEMAGIWCMHVYGTRQARVYEEYLTHDWEVTTRHSTQRFNGTLEDARTLAEVLWRLGE